MRINENEIESKWIIDIENDPRTFKKESKRRMDLERDWEKYETELWQLCYNMGASHLSAGLSSETCPAGSKFSFHEFPEHPSDSFQVDVVAVIRDYVLIISATTSGRNAVLEKERELQAHKNYISRRIDKIFPDNNLKKIFMLASSEYCFDPETMRAITSETGVIFFRKEEKKYIEDIYSKSKIKYFTFNQFLNFFYRKLDENNFFEVTSTKSLLRKNNNGPDAFFFTFAINPQKILPSCSIAHRKARELYSDQGQTATYYQRLLKGTRVTKIAKYISDDNGLPFVNNILLSYRGDINYDLDRLENYYDGSKLKIHDTPGMFHVIDGQHRLFSYSPELHPEGLDDDEEIIVTVIDGIDIKKESELFVDINKKQETVNANLLDEIELVQGGETAATLSTAVALDLREDEDSPFNNPKLINETDPTDKDEKGKFNFSAISNALKETEIISRNGNWENGLGVNRRGVTDFNETKKRIVKLVSSYFQKIKNETNWSIRDKSLDRGITISALIMVLERMVTKDNIARNTDGEIFPEIERYTEALIEGLRNQEDKVLDVIAARNFLGGKKWKDLAKVIIRLVFNSNENSHLNDPEDSIAFNAYLKEVEPDPILEETKVKLEEAEDRIRNLMNQLDASRGELRTFTSEGTITGISENDRVERSKKTLGRISQLYERIIKTNLHKFLEKELKAYEYEIREGEPVAEKDYRKKIEHMSFQHRRNHDARRKLVAVEEQIVKQENLLKENNRPLYMYSASFINPHFIKLLLQGLTDLDVRKIRNFDVGALKDKINTYFAISFNQEEINSDNNDIENSRFYYLSLINNLRNYEAAHFGVEIEGEIIPIKEAELNEFNFFEPKMKEMIEKFDEDYRDE